MNREKTRRKSLAAITAILAALAAATASAAGMDVIIDSSGIPHRKLSDAELGVERGKFPEAEAGVERRKLSEIAPARNAPPRIEPPVCAEIANAYMLALERIGTGSVRGFAGRRESPQENIILEEIHRVHERLGCDPGKIWQILRRRVEG